MRGPRGWKRGRARSHSVRVAASPAQRQMRPAFGAINSHDHFFQQGAQEFLAIAIRGGGRGPDFAQIGAESTRICFFSSWTERARALLLLAARAPLQQLPDRAAVSPTLFPARVPPACFPAPPRDIGARRVPLRSERVLPPGAIDRARHRGRLPVAASRVAVASIAAGVNAFRNASATA